MIDSSIYLLWEDELGDGEVIDQAWRDAKADSARARRLEVLMAEARTAGTPWRVIAQVFVDWMRFMEPLLPKDTQSARAALRKLDDVIDGARDLIEGRHPEGGAPSDRGDLAADRLASVLSSVVDSLAQYLDTNKPDGDPEDLDGVSAWTWTVEALAVIHEVGGPLAIDKCAELAYRRLFGARAA